MSILISVSAIALAGTAIATPFFLNWLADGDVLFTKVKEGTAKAVMIGKTFSHFVMSHRGYHLNIPGNPEFDPREPAWEVLENKRGKTPDFYDDRNWLFKKLGIFYVGIPPFRSVLRYKFAWNEEKTGTTGKLSVWVRERLTDFIYTSNFPYLIVIDSAETKDRLPVDGIYQLTVRITNPFKALFDTENWMENVSASANRQARNFIGASNYSELVSEDENREGEKGPGDSFSKPVVLLTTELPDETVVPGRKRRKTGLAGRNGVTIVSADLQQIDITGPRAAEILDATVKAYTAEQDAYATKQAGEASAAADLAKGTANATVIELKGKAEGVSLDARLSILSKFADLGQIVVQADAMKADGPGKTIIWANNPFFASKPGLADTLAGLGIKTPEDLRDLMSTNLKQ
jgi:hypothetical protein